MQIDKEAIRLAAEELCEPMVQFAQKIIQRRSDTGHEKEVADAILEELETLGFDSIKRDRTGNVIGVLKGDGSEDAILFRWIRGIWLHGSTDRFPGRLPGAISMAAGPAIQREPLPPRFTRLPC